MLALCCWILDYSKMCGLKTTTTKLVMFSGFSVGLAFGTPLTGWLWLRTSHKVAVMVSDGPEGFAGAEDLLST